MGSSFERVTRKVPSTQPVISAWLSTKKIELLKVLDNILYLRSTSISRWAYATVAGASKTIAIQKLTANSESSPS